MTAKEILNKYESFHWSEDECDEKHYYEDNVLLAMQEYGKYCADQAWNDALKEVDALMQKACWDLTLVEDIKKLKK